MAKIKTTHRRRTMGISTAQAAVLYTRLGAPLTPISPDEADSEDVIAVSPYVKDGRKRYAVGGMDYDPVAGRVYMDLTLSDSDDDDTATHISCMETDTDTSDADDTAVPAPKSWPPAIPLSMCIPATTNAHADYYRFEMWDCIDDAIPSWLVAEPDTPDR
jgi:hypothetical protein